MALVLFHGSSADAGRGGGQQSTAGGPRPTPIKPARSIGKKIPSRKFLLSVFSSSKRELRLSFLLFSLGRSPAKHLFGLNRASVQSQPWNPEPHGAFQRRDPTPRRGPETHAVNPGTIHSVGRRLSPHRSLPRSGRVQFCADLSLRRMLQSRSEVMKRSQSTLPGWLPPVCERRKQESRWPFPSPSLGFVGKGSNRPTQQRCQQAPGTWPRLPIKSPDCWLGPTQ